jgi:hypothetical protein
MDKKNKRLLFTEEPFFDESFIGYILRLAELNDIPDLRWIFRLIKPSMNFTTEYPSSFDFTIDVRALSELAGMADDRLMEMLYVHQFQDQLSIPKWLSVFGQQIPADLIRREKPKICPQCLIETAYCRKVWEIAFITVCPIHRCRLMDYCPDCGNKLNWKRPTISRCPCGFDWRKSVPNSAADKELRLTKYLHRIFNLPFGDSEFDFDYPLKTLSTEKLLKLLCFTLAYDVSHHQYTGEKIVAYLNNDSIHRHLTAAVSVFDNWANNYHEFIEAWKDKYLNHFIIERPPYAPRFSLPEGYTDYEAFNYVLREYFGKKEYPFLYREFLAFLGKLPTEEHFESYLLEYL